MKKMTRLAAIMLALIMVCAATPALADFNETGYPIVDEPLTITYIASVGTNYTEFSEMEYFKKLGELTNIYLDGEIVTQNGAERYTLMFASGDYPDISFSGCNDKQLRDAIDAEEVVALDELIDKYAPNWKALLADPDYAYVKNAITWPDGHIYSLPFINNSYGTHIRDMWMISSQWLNELKIEMPTTTDEFYLYLKALKDNAGTGTIPENVIPFACQWNAYANGGLYEVFSAFGAYSGPNYIGVNVDDLTVYCSAVKPEAKAALDYLHKLYSEGLLHPDMFTDDYTAFNNKTLNRPIIVGSYLRNRNVDESEQYYTAMPALTSPTNDTPMFRSNNNQVQKNMFVMFENCENKEAVMRFIDTMLDPLWSAQAVLGMLGGVTLADDGDGTYTALSWPTDYTLQDYCPNNAVPVISFGPWEQENVTTSSTVELAMRYINEVYADALMPVESLYPTTIMWNDEDKQTRCGELQTDIVNHINSTFAQAIVNGMTDAEFDTFVKDLENIGLAEWLELQQEQLDIYYRK